MEHSTCGILALVFGIIGALCLGKWFAVVPIALAIIFALIGVSDPLKYRWPAIVGAVCAVTGIIFCGGRLILSESNSVSIVSPSATAPVQTASVQNYSTSTPSINQTNGWSDYSVFAIDVRNISFPDDYGVMTASQTVNENVFQDSELLSFAKDFISTGSGIVALSPDYSYMYDFKSYVSDDYRDFSEIPDAELEEVLSVVEEGFANTGYSVKNKTFKVIGDVKYVEYTGTYTNTTNNEPRSFWQYISNVNGQMYSMMVSSRDVSAIDRNNQVINQVMNSVRYYSSYEPQTNVQAVTVDTYSTPSDGNYRIGDTWTVPGQWNFTITKVEETSDRNQFSDKNPQAVYNITSRWENIGYVDSSGLFDGLYFDVTGGAIIDSMGQMGYSYPGSGDTYAGEVPVGAYSESVDVVGVEHAGDFTITIYKYDGNEQRQSATFNINVN